MLIIERCDPSDAEHHAFHWDNSVWSAIGILVPGLQEDGQWVGTEGSICVEFFTVTLKEYKWLFSYTSPAFFVYLSAFYTQQSSSLLRKLK